MAIPARTPEDLSVAQQRYIECIAELCDRQGFARTSEVAARLDVSMPSVSQVVSRLVETCITSRIEGHGITLSVEGKRVADQLSRRHAALRQFMIDVLAMHPARADELACRVEHCVDRAFADRLLEVAGCLENEYPWTLRGVAEYMRRHVGTQDAMDFSI